MVLTACGWVLVQLVVLTRGHLRKTSYSASFNVSGASTDTLKNASSGGSVNVSGTSLDPLSLNLSHSELQVPGSVKDIYDEDADEIPENASSEAAAVSLLNHLSIGSTILNRAGDKRTPLSDLCQLFSLDTTDCGRVTKYLGSLSGSDLPVKVYTDRIVSGLSQVKENTVTAMRIADFACENDMNLNCHSGNEQAEAACRVKIYSSDFCKTVRAISTRQSSTNIANKSVLFSFGDCQTKSHEPCPNMCNPTIVKTRPFNDPRNMVLMNLNMARHWGEIKSAMASDVPFSQKQNRLMWRGASTGPCDTNKKGSRMMFVSKYARSSDPRIDVGFNTVVQGCGAASAYVKGSYSLSTALKSKYLMVVNGNDKASSLNWILASNSVPFMTRPAVESWLLETSLEPWKHYIPIEDDFSDVVSKLDWIAKNEDEGARVANAGQQYVKKFLDGEKEGRIQAAVLTAYVDRVSIGVEPGHGSNCQT